MRENLLNQIRRNMCDADECIIPVARCKYQGTMYTVISILRENGNLYFQASSEKLIPLDAFGVKVLSRLVEITDF